MIKTNFAIIKPQAFAVVCGTELFEVTDADWVVIYDSSLSVYNRLGIEKSHFCKPE